MGLLNPQTAGDWGTFGGFCLALVTAVVSVVMWPYKTFITKKALLVHEEKDAEMFVKKVEADGTRTYVHVTEMKEIKDMLQKNLDTTEKWQAIAKDWMRNP